MWYNYPRKRFELLTCLLESRIHITKGQAKMKKTNKLLFTAVVCALVMVIFSVCALAYTPGTGYMKDDTGAETNIKYTVTDGGEVTVEIDASATDKVQTTVVPYKDPITGEKGSWNKALDTFNGATKLIVGDGITSLPAIMINNQKLETVEIPASLVELTGQTFETCSKLKTIYIRGNDPVEGTFDLTNITKLDNYVFDGCGSVSAIKLNPNYADVLPIEFIKNNAALTELEIPAGTTMLKNKSLSRLSKLATLTIKGSETILESISVFEGATVYPAIKAPAGSKAEEFAKANGFTFIDLETGEETKGTLPAPGTTSGTASGGTSSATTPAVSDFEPEEGVTAWGHSTGMYNGGQIINTWWAYYDATKTLKFTSATTSYNETGGAGDCDDGASWSEYKEVIEHIVVGPNINKMSGSAFANMTALKDVEYYNAGIQCDYGCFTGCKSLTTIWRTGSDRIEGRADCSGFSKVNDVFQKTAIKEIILPTSQTTLTVALPMTIKTIYAVAINEDLRAYCEENLFNLSSLDGSIVYEYYVEVPDGLVDCGGRAAYSFDEATGILEIYGAGAIQDTNNYYGGGSKNNPFFEVKEKVKHIILADRITAIGKYAFTEMVNLETVQLPDADIEIGNAAFEKCTNLKSVYRKGTDPIEGTVDISRVKEVKSYIFAYDYLIANVIVNEEVKNIGSSVFDENTNLANVYGVPGSYAETYAQKNNLTFYDISTNTPVAIQCEMPVITTEPVTTEPTPVVTEPVTTEPVETEPETTEPETTAPETEPVVVDVDDSEGGSSATVIIIVIVVVVVVVAAAAAVVVIGKKKKTAKK